MSHRSSWMLSVVGVAALLLTGCQGTEWGEQVRRAVRVPQEERSPNREDQVPSDPPTPSPRSTPADAVSDPERSPTPRPVTLSTPFTTDPDVDLDLDLDPDTDPAPAPPDPEPDSPTAARLRFTDLEDYPLASHAVGQLDHLNVFPEISGPEFEPERSVRRGEFARWLIRANNAIHSQDPSGQIRLARSGERPIFLDVPEDHPDFTPIQTLGVAGIAEGDENQEFRPDSLLSRSALVQLKAPLDLPPGGIEGDRAALQEEWGFTDGEEIPEAAVAAIVADRTLGEQSSILRAFGPIRSFDPQKPVTRAEAALALSAFGERIAAEAIEQGSTAIPILPVAPSPDPSPSPTPAPSPTPTLEPSPSPTPEPSPDPTPTASPADQPDQPEADPDPDPSDPDQTPSDPDPQTSPDRGSNADSPESAPGEFLNLSDDLDDPEP